MNADDLVKKLLDEVYTGNDAPTPPPEPESERPTMNLGTIFAALPPGVDEQAIAIMNQENNTSSMARELKALLAPHAAALESVGVVADYLAWMLVAVAQRERGIQ
jgi:hypothetical protein